MLQDYHVHALAHGEYQYTYDWLKKFLMTARERQIVELGFAEHDEFISRIDTTVLERLQEEFPDIKLRLGLEVDYIPGREDYIRQLCRSYDFDYIIGSVHFIDGWGFDHPDFRHLFEEKDIDQVYSRYFELVQMAVKSGLFDIIGHLDLIKIWGHRPRLYDLLFHVKQLLKSIKDSGMVIEINSAGLRKPVGEIYPQQEIINLMASKQIAVTLGSDAHHPWQVGEGLQEAQGVLINAGFTYLASLQQRQVRMQSLNKDLKENVK
jgi:histidinol-phosphatase (PHP family)